MQLGADKGIRIESAMLYTGLIFTHTSTNAELSGSYYGDTKSYGLGGYTSIFFDNGFILILSLNTSIQQTFIAI
ncbi:autotransporter outer membrane beta-barrel domain-containing protein [Escherichia coli]|nr:autotransporter outer membrane beta-barrel domain-containing protein [Escherichia coli]